MSTYTFKNSIVLSTSAGAQWTELDLSDKILSNIFLLYRRVLVTVHNTVTNEDQTFDLETYRASYSNYNASLSQWLSTAMDGVALIVLTPSEIPNYSLAQVLYANLFRLRYKVNKAIMGMNVPNNYSGYLPDLKITKNLYTANVAKLDTHALVSINGFIHNTASSSSDSSYVYVEEGAKSVDKCRANGIGMLSFADIAPIRRLRIKPENISSNSASGNLYDQLTFSVELPNDMTTLDNKSFILVLGGYMIFIKENIFFKQGDLSFSLNLKTIRYVDRILESDQFLDLSKLGLTKYPQYNDAYNTAELIGNDVIKKYFTLSQSFLVVVDTPVLYTDTITIKNCDIPGNFRTYTEPRYPLFVGHGRIAEYWHTRQVGYWEVTVTDPYLRNFILTQGPELTSGYITDQLDPTKPTASLRGHFVAISGTAA